ncbi:MAG TPA: response regulator [Verrucomicrobiae bacterium]|jgi:hypothetical protein|nr:response regulator [Verrucomicrobiae bacterium]
MNILIVDDDPTNRKLLSAVLRAENLEIQEAADGQQAFGLLQQQSFDAVISDILMPNMDGYELCREVRQNQRLNALPFIHYSSTYSSPVDVKLSESVGADKYLAKPASTIELLEALREVTSNQKYRAARPHPAIDEIVLMREYNSVLVRKLEQRNEDLELAQNRLLRTNRELQARTAELAQLNEELDRRVHQRTVELEAANADLESFSYSVSHDLRAPLRHISGYTHMLEHEFGPRMEPQAQRLIANINRGVANMARLIDALLRLAHLGQQKLAKRQLNLEPIVQEVLADLLKDQSGRAIEVMVGSLPPCVGDPGMLKQVFVNLLSNALKFTRHKDRAKIEVSSRPTDDHPIYFVRDNGAGFDMRYVDKLFGAFQRLHAREEFEGTGIGLSLTHRIIVKHGGRIWADGEAGVGATFSFTLGK